MILTLPMKWIKMSLIFAGWKQDIDQVNTMKQYATKRWGYIALHALIKTKNLIIVIDFMVFIQILGLASCNINIVFTKWSIDLFVSLLSFIFLLNSFLHLFSSCSIDHHLFQSLCLITLSICLSCCYVF